jgi:hypothetical protein
MTRKAERAARQQIASTHPFVAKYQLAVRCRCWLAHMAKVEQLIAEARQS